MTTKKHDDEHDAKKHDDEHERDNSKVEVAATPAPKVAPTEQPFPYTQSINEPQTVSLPLPADVVVPKPAITSLNPAECVIGDADFTLDVTGENFFADSVINFAGHDEPTTFNAPDTLSTGVKPSLWSEPVVVQVTVKNGPEISEPVDFTFAVAATRKGRR